MSNPHLLNQIRQHMDAGELSQAEALLRNGLPPETDATFCYQWGLLCEETGLLTEALQAFQQVLHHQSDHVEAAYRLALLYLDQNAPDKALPYLQHVLRLHPAHTDAAYDLATLLAERGEVALAAQVCRRTMEQAPTEALAQLSRSLVPESPLPAGELQDTFLPDFVSFFLQRFSGREGVYARQWVDATGRSGYTPVHEPLTEREIRSHLRGDITLGVYPLRLDNTVSFLAIDIDISKRALEQSRNDAPEFTRLQALAQEHAKALVQQGNTLGLSLSIEDSGYKGRHVWLFLEQPVEARRVRDLGKLLLTLTGDPPLEIQREIFPKQDTLTPEALGNLIKLPLGMHRRTGKRSAFLDQDGHLLADQYAVLQGVVLASPAQIAHALDQAIQLRSHTGYAGPKETLLPTLTAQRKIPESPELTTLRAGCAVLNHLLDKAATEHHLTHDERITLLCVLPHLSNGTELLHGIIQQCTDYNAKVTQAWIERRPPHPISCPKIRTKLPAVTSKVGCFCQFQLPPDGYPSPLLHLNPGATEGRAALKQEDRITVVMTRLLTLRTQERSLHAQIQACEQELITLMGEQGVEEMVTAFGRLRRKTNVEGKGWVLEIDETQR